VARAFRSPAVTGVALSSAIQAAEEPGTAIERLREALEEAWRARERKG
jgi:thiamine monophosphate synthase